MALIGLQKEVFNSTLHLLALRVPTNRSGYYLKEFHGFLAKKSPLVKNVIPVEDDPKSRLIVLDEKFQSESDLPEKQVNIIREQNLSLVRRDIKVDIRHYTTDEVLRKVLPEELKDDLPTAFETAGHIAHLNLREKYLPYKKLVAEVILEKNPRIKTVVNKVGKVDSKFRTFQMELLAGEDKLDTEVNESKCIFRFNFGEVYWNSRLQREHERLVNLFKPDDVICDMFAGVGPFAVPAAKNKGCQVYANDLNPHSFKYLQENVKRNKVCTSSCNGTIETRKVENKVTCFNMDGRDFVRHLVQNGKVFNTVVMNLPATAVEFLDVFRGLFPPNHPLPMIHCYGFTAAKGDIQKQVEDILCAKISPTIYDVRHVAPKKDMMCVSFLLPKEIAFSKVEPPTKKQKQDKES